MAASAKELTDAFVKVSFQEDGDGDPLMGHWLDQGAHRTNLKRAFLIVSFIFIGSAKHSSPLVLL
jgi:hypothetical protein